MSVTGDLSDQSVKFHHFSQFYRDYHSALIFTVVLTKYCSVICSVIHYVTYDLVRILYLPLHRPGTRDHTRMGPRDEENLERTLGVYT